LTRSDAGDSLQNTWHERKQVFYLVTSSDEDDHAYRKPAQVLLELKVPIRGQKDVETTLGSAPK